jgi:acetolactate synthase I/III small subunit
MSDPGGTEPQRHVVSALVIDRPGTLNRVASLLRARSFNIDSLTVGATHEPGQSRMTIVTRGDDAHLHQVIAQLNRLVDVLDVRELSHGRLVELELALVEIDAPPDDGSAQSVHSAMRLAGGELLSEAPGIWRLRLAAAPDDIEGALAALRNHGLRTLVRAGSVAMATTEQMGESSA